jgi:uncharacterized protein (TIGR03085 family)
MARVSASALAREERAQLCELLEQVGPDAPTLCEGWDAKDLAAHLVVREGRPDASLGIVIGPLAAWTERVQNGAASEPYDKLVRLIRNGPPVWSAFRLPLVDGQANTVEFFVHLEDVRRAQPDWQPRELSGELTEFLWDRLRSSGRMLFGKVKGGVLLQRTDVPGAEPVRLRSGEPAVTLVGDPAELTMLAFGRKEHRARIEGDPAAVAAFSAAKLGI